MGSSPFSERKGWAHRPAISLSRSGIFIDHEKNYKNVLSPDPSAPYTDTRRLALSSGCGSVESSLHIVSQILLPIFAPHRTRRPSANPTNLLDPQAHRYVLITCAWTCRKRHPLFEQVHCHIVCEKLNLTSPMVTRILRKIGPWDLCWFKRWNIEKGNFSLIADICPECWTFIPIGIHCHLVPIGKHCTHMCPECWTSSSHFGEQ